MEPSAVPIRSIDNQEGRTPTYWILQVPLCFTKWYVEISLPKVAEYVYVDLNVAD